MAKIRLVIGKNPMHLRVTRPIAEEVERQLQARGHEVRILRINPQNTFYYVIKSHVEGRTRLNHAVRQLREIQRHERELDELVYPVEHEDVQDTPRYVHISGKEGSQREVIMPKNGALFFRMPVTPIESRLTQEEEKRRQRLQEKIDELNKSGKLGAEFRGLVEQTSLSPSRPNAASSEEYRAKIAKILADAIEEFLGKQEARQKGDEYVEELMRKK